MFARVRSRIAFGSMVFMWVVAVSASMADDRPASSSVDPVGQPLVGDTGAFHLALPVLAEVGDSTDRGFAATDSDLASVSTAIRPGVVLTGAASGEVIYSNPQGFRLIQPGVGTRIADELNVICTYSEITGVTVGVGGGGSGSGPGFSFTIEMFDGCPSDGGQVIPDSLRTVQVRDDGTWYVNVDYSNEPIPIGRSVWLALTFLSDSAGVIVGNKPELGRSGDFVDFYNPCSTQLTGEGDPAHVFANFVAMVRAENCVPAYLAYAADHPSAFFFEIGGDHGATAVADDIRAVTREGEGCEMVDYSTSWVGLDGPYCGVNEVWTNEPADHVDRPLAPVPGTRRDCCADPAGCRRMFDPPIPLPPGAFWISYEPHGNRAGPVFNIGYPSIGMSGECIAIFGSPNPGVWSSCDWIDPGCDPNHPSPCLFFVGTVTCAGTEPTGSCCTPTAGGSSCLDDMRATECHGRFAEGLSCSEATFDPPCDLAACCEPTQQCVDRTFDECRALGGLWQAEEFCDRGLQACPPAACVVAQHACNEAHEFQAGCSHVACCQTVCDIDNFCCAVAWDETCVALAADSCELPPLCPASPVFFLDPPDGVVDARQPHALSDPTPQGISTIRVAAQAGLRAECLSVCAPGETVPVTVTAINYIGAGEYEVVLSRPLDVNKVWQIAYNADDGSRTALTLTSHPGNVNGDDWSSPLDALALINCLSGVNLATDCPFGLYSTDMDHSGLFGPADVLRLLDLMNGAETYDAWSWTKKRDPLCAN